MGVSFMSVTVLGDCFCMPGQRNSNSRESE